MDIKVTQKTYEDTQQPYTLLELNYANGPYEFELLPPQVQELVTKLLGYSPAQLISLLRTASRELELHATKHDRGMRDLITNINTVVNSITS